MEIIMRFMGDGAIVDAGELIARSAGEDARFRIARAFLMDLRGILLTRAPTW